MATIAELQPRFKKKYCDPSTVFEPSILFGVKPESDVDIESHVTSRSNVFMCLILKFLQLIHWTRARHTASRHVLCPTKHGNHPISRKGLPRFNKPIRAHNVLVHADKSCIRHDLGKRTPAVRKLFFETVPEEWPHQASCRDWGIRPPPKVPSICKIALFPLESSAWFQEPIEVANRDVPVGGIHCRREETNMNDIVAVVLRGRWRPFDIHDTKFNVGGQTFRRGRCRIHEGLPWDKLLQVLTRTVQSRYRCPRWLESVIACWWLMDGVNIQCFYARPHENVSGSSWKLNHIHGLYRFKSSSCSSNLDVLLARVGRLHSSIRATSGTLSRCDPCCRCKHQTLKARRS